MDDSNDDSYWQECSKKEEGIYALKKAKHAKLKQKITQIFEVTTIMIINI